jgi:GDP-4-dehydro-6-deoxy-D-mannose reductase
MSYNPWRIGLDTMKVLVTGINGFVGCHLSGLLAEKGYCVLGSRVDDANLDVITSRVPSSNLHVCDLRDRPVVDQLLRVTRPDAVIHLAGQSWVPASWQDPATTFDINLKGTIHLFEAILGNAPQSRCIFISTGDFYDVTGSVDAAADEESPIIPRNPYALSKMTADLLARQLFLSRGLQVVRLRPFNHIGPHQSERFVVSEFAKKIAEIELGLGEPLIMVGNLDVERDFTDVRDMVRAYELALSKCAAGECYNVSSQKAYRIRSMLDILLANSSAEIRVETDPAKYRPVEVTRFLGNSGRFRTATGWQPDIPIEKTIADVLDYWRGRIRDEQAAV